jgi:hypothetical protein
VKIHYLLLLFFLFSCTPLLAQPNHTYLLYSDKLDQPTSVFSEFVNTDGVFIAGKGWQAKTTTSQLFIALPKNLPAEGTLIIDVNKFNPVDQNAGDKQNIINLYSQRNGSKDIFETDGSWWNIRTGTGYSEGAGMAGFKFLAAPRGIDSREEQRCIERKDDWRESLWYQFKVIWTREKIYCFFDGDLVSTLPFDGQIELFRYIFLGTDNVYTAMPGPIYGNLRIYGSQPDPSTLFTLSKISGDGQSGAPLQPLALPLVVRVANQLGVGADKTQVVFAAQNGGVMVEAQPVQTNQDGYASATLKLGNSEGRYEVFVTSEKTDSSKLIFYANALTPDVYSLSAVSGNAQIGEPGRPLALPFMVRVQNQHGQGVPNTHVAFAPQNGGNMVESQPVLTDADGYAHSSFLLGGSERRYEVIVTSERTGSSQIVFYANAVAPDIYSLLAVSGNAQTGEPGKALALPFMVRVQNQHGQGVPNTHVIFAPQNGGRMVEAQPVLTDADGQARSSLILGDNEGSYSVSVTSDKTGEASIQFIASAVKPKIIISKSSGDGQTGTVGRALAAPCVVMARDDLGRMVADVEIEFFVETGSGSIVDGSVVKKIKTDAAGYASVVWTPGPVAGVKHLYAKFEETTLTFSAIASAGAPKRLVNTANNGPYTAGKSYEFACRLEDNFGNPCAGAQIAFAVESGNGNINGSNSALLPTDNEGAVKVTWMLGLNHTYINRLSAKLDGSTDDSLTVVFQLQNVLPPSLAQSRITADSVAAADGIDSVRISVVLKNDDGLALPDYFVQVMVSGRDNQLVVSNSITDITGKVAAILRSTAAEVKTITAVVNGVGSVPGSIDVVFRDPSIPYIRLMAVIGEDQAGVVGTTLPQPLVVWVADEQNHARSDIPVLFSATAGGLVNGQSTFETASNGSGLAQVMWTLGSLAGRNSDSVRVTLPGRLAPPIFFTARALAGAPKQMIPMTADSLTAAAGDSLQLILRVQDGFGNSTQKTPVFFESLQNGAVKSQQPVLTDSMGVCRASVVIGSRAEACVFKASVNDSLAVTWTFFVTVLKERLIAVPADTIKLSESRDVELAVICVDSSSVCLKNIPVQFSRVAGAGDFHGSPVVVSDAGGYASVIWRPVESSETTVIQATSPNDSVRFYIRFTIQSSVAKHDLPLSLSLGDSYPNPFNPTTMIPFTLTEAGHVTLKVYDVNGRVVCTLLDGQMAAGAHSAVFNAAKDGETTPSGIYFFKLVAGDFQAVKQVLLIK